MYQMTCQDDRASFCDFEAVRDSNQTDDLVKLLECSEGERLLIPGGADNVRWAWYGDPEQKWEEESAGAVCTDIVRQRLEQQDEAAVVAANAWLGCDPAPGMSKVLIVELETPMQAEDPEVNYPTVFASVDAMPSAHQWVVFARHAQAGHNVDHDLVHNPDNALTSCGRQQALAAGASALGSALRSADLIISSPLTRAMETTALLLEAAATSSPAREPPRVMVHAAATERWSAPCDEGTPKSELIKRLPEHMRNWEGWTVLPERWWADPGEDPWARAEAFVELLRHRPEKRIAVVGHGGFWDIVIGEYLENCCHVFCDRDLS